MNLLLAFLFSLKKASITHSKWRNLNIWKFRRNRSHIYFEWRILYNWRSRRNRNHNSSFRCVGSFSWSSATYIIDLAGTQLLYLLIYYWFLLLISTDLGVIVTQLKSQNSSTTITPVTLRYAKKKTYNKLKTQCLLIKSIFISSNTVLD